MSPLKLKARSAVHGFTMSSSCLRLPVIRCAVPSSKAGVAPTTTKAQLLYWGVYLALNRTSIKCYILLEGVNSNKVS